MHSLKCDNNTNVLFNGDFSGDVIFVSATERITIPIKHLDVFFAERLRRQKIAQIEALSDRAVIREAIDSL